MKRLILWLVVIAVIVFAVIKTFATYNEIVQTEKLVEEAKAQVGVVCQRRLDLIPNLVEVVRGYAKHERQVLVELTSARTRAQTVLSDITGKASLSKDEAEALRSSQAEVGQAIGNLMVVVENYPDLKASSNFRALQDQLEGTENRIAVARMRYNGAVRRYNTYIRMVPGNVVAWIFGFSVKEYFEAEEDAESPVEIRF
jgi:LemA protein